MYRDKTLIPTEAIRLCGLGILAAGPKLYAELASEVRNFSSRIMGPSLDVLGPSLDLLRLEGLIEADPVAAERGNPKLRITKQGLAALNELLRSNIRAPIDDLNKLVIALKMRFLHMLDHEARQEQIEALIGLFENELTRLRDLRDQPCGGESYLADWLDHEIAQGESRQAFLTGYRERV
jgi:DNA-binding PadR family transcriptional regulator